MRAAVEVTAMDLDVVATKDGRPVNDLARDEFVVRVDGKPVPIDYFARIEAGAVHGPDLATASPDLVLDTLKSDDGETYVPRQFLVYFDDDRLLPQERRSVIEGLRDFVTRLSPSDRASIVSYNGSTRVLVPFTNSKEDLLDGLSRLEKASPAGLSWEAQYRADDPGAAALTAFLARRNPPQLVGAGRRTREDPPSGSWHAASPPSRHAPASGRSCS